MSYTLGEAAKAAGFSKPTLSRAIKNGKLTAKRLDDGSYQIHPSELERWKDANGHRNTPVTQIKTPDETPETPSRNSALQAEVEALRQQVETADKERTRERDQLVDQIEDLRTRLTKADAERTRLTLMLTDQRQKPAETPKRGLWARIMG
jgi:excisionase family DNA binding protein